LHIGSRPGEKVFVARQGGDTFLVLSTTERMVRLYKTVETLMAPSPEMARQYHDEPYFWVESTDMMYVLSEVSFADCSNVQSAEEGVTILESLEGYLQPL
jgi:hypothetical protein